MTFVRWVGRVPMDLDIIRDSQEIVATEIVLPGPFFFEVHVLCEKCYWWLLALFLQKHVGNNSSGAY